GAALPRPQRGRLGAGGAAQHGRAQVRAAQAARSHPRRGGDHGRVPSGAGEPRRGVSSRTPGRAGPDRARSAGRWRPVTDQLAVVRYTVFAVFALAVLVAVGSWLVRTRRVSPFSGAGKLLRQLTDPVMKPIERRVIRRGGNPVQAGWWLVLAVA